MLRKQVRIAYINRLAHSYDRRHARCDKVPRERMQVLRRLGALTAVEHYQPQRVHPSEPSEKLTAKCNATAVFLCSTVRACFELELWADVGNTMAEKMYDVRYVST